jgi:tetratricopeptide (TPR) repeat protein
VAKAVSVQERLAGLEDGALWDAVVQWTHTNRVAIGGVIGALVVLASGMVYFRYQKAVALEGLRRGIATLQHGDAPKSLEDLRKVKGSSLSVAERTLGLFYMGEAYARLEKKEDALKSYEEGLNVIKSGAAGTYLEQLLLVKIAQSEESRGADGQARQRYEQAAMIEGPFKTEALASAGRLAEKLNDSAAAKAHYEKLSSVNVSYPLIEIFQEKVGK